VLALDAWNNDRLMVGIRTERLELDKAWSFVGKKQENIKRHEVNAKAITTFSSARPERRRPLSLGASAS
jgi:hypothetical protein